MHTVPQDIWDPARQAWQIAWSGHILLTDPAHLWHANAFYPERYSFAYGDSLLGYAPAGMLGSGPDAAILRYNILFVLAHALLAIGAYALVRQLGARPTGAAVAGGGLRLRAVAARPGGPPGHRLGRRHPAGPGDAGPRARLVPAVRPAAHRTGMRAGPRRAGWSRPGRSASASRSVCRSGTYWPASCWSS